MELPIMTGHSYDQLRTGHAFQWGKGMFKIESIGDNESTLVRMGSQDIISFDQTNVLNPSQFHELDTWTTPGPQLEEPVRPVINGDFLDVTKKDSRGGDVLEKGKVFPKELKSPRPPLRDPKIVDDEPRDTSKQYS
jgi:hypothetical protein